MARMLSMSQETAQGDPFEGRKLLFCVGAQKAGTSWLHDYFTSHPDVHVPLCKEMHYFDNLFGPEVGGFEKRRRARLNALMSNGTPLQVWATGGLTRFPSPEYTQALVAMHDSPDGQHDNYKALLAHGAVNETYLVDITPSYCLVGEDGLREMLRIAPDAKFLFLMRDPVDRLWSSVRFQHAAMVQHKKTETVPDVKQLARSVMKGTSGPLTRRGGYSETVRALDSVVPEENRLYLFYETLFTESAIEALCGFMGIDPKPGDFDKKVLPGVSHDLPPQLERRMRAFLNHEYEFAQQRFGDAVPQAWRKDAKPRPVHQDGPLGERRL